MKHVHPSDITPTACRHHTPQFASFLLFQSVISRNSRRIKLSIKRIISIDTYNCCHQQLDIYCRFRLLIIISCTEPKHWAGCYVIDSFVIANRPLIVCCSLATFNGSNQTNPNVWHDLAAWEHTTCFRAQRHCGKGWRSLSISSDDCVSARSLEQELHRFCDFISLNSLNHRSTAGL